MIVEKAPACANAMLAAWQASMLAAWQSPFDPARAIFAGIDAWTRVLAREACANRRRLSEYAARWALEAAGRSSR